MALTAEQRKKIAAHTNPVTAEKQKIKASAKASSSKASSASKSTSNSSYNAPTYNEKKYRAGLDTSYYTNAINTNTAQVNKERNAQLAEAQKTQQSNLRQAYINKLQNQRTLDNNLAASGIRGGATETSNLRLANMYGQSVSAANSDYANSVNTINQNADRTIADYNSEMNSLAEQYRQNQANARWQAAREDYANKRSEATNEKNRLTDYWSNYYTNYYSGFSKKDAKKAVKKIEKKMKAAKTSAEKLRWQQAMSGVRARLGVIKNK